MTKVVAAAGLLSLLLPHSSPVPQNLHPPHLSPIHDVGLLDDSICDLRLLKGHETKPTRAGSLSITHDHLRECVDGQ